MHLLQPSSCSCYSLKLPSLPSATTAGPLDAPTRRRYTLDCRTGAAVELTRSNVFVHGGLTIPLNLTQVNSVQIQKELILYFAKEKTTGSAFKRLNDWISSETFFLDLITRTWERVEATVEEEPKSDDDTDDGNFTPTLKERLYHSMCFAGSYLYIFGGLIVSPHSGYELIATNDLWKLDLQAKKWSLVSKDPQITRRFTHSMHTLNEEDDSKDTKIVITGGLNNIDKPIHHVDIFNITKNCWETDANGNSQCRIFSNVEGEKVSLLKESNYSILVENNEAKIPSLAFYTAEKEGFTKEKKKGSKLIKEGSPIVALPLLSESQGMRMISNQNHFSTTADMPSNLQFPTGDYFCYTIVMSGFYPNCQASSFRCFVYDIPSGKWTRVGIVCKDGDFNKHRFWKLFVWQSHHQTVLLGTKNDDDCLPSVQKFDFLLSFGLPMISIYNKSVHSAVKQEIKLSAHKSNPQAPYVSPSSSFSSDKNVGEGQEDEAFRKPSYASSATSQFESYIRYIAPPIEMTSIRTVFPPYAMVLGKDALEIFGNPLSDFEFITDKGDSIGVPLYLLRKRWGRYFDMLLSQGYVRACAEYENSGAPSEIVKISPYSSQAISCSKNSEVSSSGSLDAYFTSTKAQRPKSLSKAQEKGSAGDEESAPAEHPLSHLMSNSSTSPFFENDDEDPVSPPALSRVGKEQSNRDTRSIRRIGTGSTTSSSGGMVFRVPFQENNPMALSDSSLIKNSNVEEKRRSSSVANAALDYLRPNHLAEKWRRASHPNSSLSSPDDTRFHGSSARFPQTSGHSSRNTSITSQTSSLSYVSSSSDRMGNSIFAQGTGVNNADNPQGTVLNIGLPPQTSMPNDPLPPVPQDAANNTGRRNSSFADFVLSNRSSPFSSRRPSHDRRSSSSDSSRPLDQLQTSLDRQLMDDRSASGDLTPGHHRSFFSRMNSRSADSGPTNLSKVSKSDTNRLSLSSNPESTESAMSGPLEWEPLLTPRTLYMPWPTATVRAFAEFFFTGQVNGKWVLAPVVLNLLLMSKLYEIPLLYNLITEVLYSIVGRKEDSLYVICASLTDAFHKKVADYCNNDEALIQSYLEEDELYVELLKVRESLENIDNGTFDLDLIKNVTRAFSSSTHRSSETGTDKLSVGTPTFRSSVGGGNHIPTVFAGGPRDSQDSSGSLAYPASLNIPRRGQSTTGGNAKLKKKSSLSQEIGPAFDGVGVPSAARVSSDTALNTISDRLSEDREATLSDEESDSSSSADNNLYKELDDENYATDEEYETTIIDARTSGYRDDEEEDKEYQKNIHKLGSISQKNKNDDSASSQSESDGINSDLGLLSINKMKRKIAGQLDIEESIDPLFKIGFTPQSPSRDNQSRSKFSILGEPPRDHSAANEASSTTPTLENLAPPNALPPVDYVIKSIARTAALVNYPRLMVRCLDCVEISKRLRSIKRRLAADFTRLDEECSISTPQEVLRRRLLEKQKSDSALAKSMCTSTSWTVKQERSPTAEKYRSKSTMLSDTQLSPKTSVSGDAESATPGTQPRRMQAKVGGEDPLVPSGGPVLMNPAFMPPPPSSSGRGRKNYGSSGTSGFSFFGKKK